MERRERSNKYFFLIFEKLPKLTKLNSFGTKEMLLFFCLFQLSRILDGTQLLQLEYKTMLHQIPLKARSVSCSYNATQKILVCISYMCILLIFLVNNPNSHSGVFLVRGKSWGDNLPFLHFFSLTARDQPKSKVDPNTHTF